MMPVPPALRGCIPERGLAAALPRPSCVISRAPHRTPSILVVDDDAAIRSLVAITLADEGFRVATAPNGQEALLAAGLHEPDVIILDMQMPVMDGPACYRALRSAGIGAAVIVLSAHRARAAALAMGAEAAMEKPFDPADLVRRVRRLAST